MSTKRLFFAVDLSDETLDELTDLQESCREATSDSVRIRWTPRENMHLTLKFLGSHEPDLVETFADTMDGIVADIAPFEMTTRQVGAFPHPRHPRILWAGADDRAQATLESMHREAERALGQYGVEEDEHSYKAHVTFARVKSNNAPSLDGLQPEDPPESFGTTEVEHVTLYESELDDSGATYHLLHRSPLGG